MNQMCVCNFSFRSQGDVFPPSARIAFCGKLVDVKGVIVGLRPPPGSSEVSDPGLGWTQSQASYGLVRSRSAIFFSISLMATAPGLHLAKRRCNSWVALCKKNS